MGCPGKCDGCERCGAKLGAYTQAPPLAFAGWRLRLGGNPPGGQYHGYLGAEHRVDERVSLGPSPWDFFNPGETDVNGIYRSPGETPPSANPNREMNTIVVPHTRRRAGYAVVPGAYSHLGMMFDPCAQVPAQYRASCSASPYEIPDGPTAPAPTPAPAPRPVFPVIPISNVRYATPYFVRAGIYSTGSTQSVLQPPPAESPSPAPSVQNAPPPPTMYRDAAGNLTSDWHNPYSLYLPEGVQIQPSPIVNANTSLTPGPGQTATSVPSSSVQGNAVSPASWFTDPTQSLISGIPNWGIVAAAAAAFFLLKGRR